ncbi:MAG: NAD-binding protein [Thermosynechococcus sp. Uc]|uniref:potassium channel family protein n=1 Tax=Thermosynechococcus sp. Uc TaxID=3034853 RepID=UPI00259DDF7E|nr:NAD-binding protein [Thermosynechococcus sp. Uc]MDM7327050.1 NAD-binding protein [Thermosynechococcus sp. Uc]
MTPPSHLAHFKDHVIICGYGSLGRTLAMNLAAAQIPFVVIDNQRQRLRLAQQSGHPFYRGDDLMDENELLAVGVDRARTLVAVLPDDASNVFITLIARRLNPNLQILAYGELPATESKLRFAGADHVVLPSSISAQRIVQLITRPTVLDFLEEKEERSHLIELLSQLDLQIEEFTLPLESPLLGLAIAEVEAKGRGRFIIVAVRRCNGSLVTHPPLSLPLQAKDTVIALGQAAEIQTFFRQHAPRYRRFRI